MSLQTVLITGPKTAAGARILEDLVRRGDVERIYLLSADEAGASPARAVAHVVQAENGPQVVRLCGDPAQPRLGLDNGMLERMAGAVDTIFHCAERPDLDQDIESARRYNVQPLRALLGLLESATRARLVHLSTTWVCGNKRGLFTEFDLACEQVFFNAYEQSKYEAERILRDSAVSKRVTIVRRSWTMEPGGGSADSRLASLLSSARVARRILVCGDPRARLDAIPIEHLSAGVIALAGERGAMGRTVHLVAGWEGSWSLRELVDLLRSRRRTAPVAFWPQGLAAIARLLGPLTLGRIKPFPGVAALLPYLRQRCVFDDFLGKSFLAPLGIACPQPGEFIGRLLDSAAPPAPPVGQPSPPIAAESDGRHKREVREAMRI
jgi:nucleoside-diphosphate-sugar epimerase